jgi:aryl-alcohol dehydrogenase-like predicted oxidoreductase
MFLKIKLEGFIQVGGVKGRRPKAGAHLTQGKELDMPLRKRALGKTGMEVAEVGLGLWAVSGSQWGAAEDGETLAAIDKALEMGVNFFDTADVYGQGHSEELLGKAMKGRRDKFIVSTKIGWIGFDGQANSTQYTTVEKLIAGVESSLRRLQSDYVDILFSHIFYEDKTLPVLLEGFEKLQRQGKVKGYGVSTSNFEFLKKFNANGKCSVAQVDYSLLNRTPEADIFPYCQGEKIGLVIRGPLAMGILSAKFSGDTRFEPGDFRNNWIEKPGERKIFEEDLEKVERIKPLLKGKTMPQLALQFTLSHPAVSVIIPGAKRPRQLEENVSAGLLPPLSAQELGQLDSITPPKGGRKIWPA